MVARSPSVSEYEAKMTFRSGLSPMIQAMKSVTARLLPCCGGDEITSFGRLPSISS
jgi:hypothetical protein